MQAFPKKRGILAVFLTDLQSEYNHTLLEGITKQANALRYDIVTFSFFSNANCDTPFQTGEENILSLFHKGYADGILTQKGMFQKPEVRQRIDQICLESGLPFLDIGEENCDAVYPLWNDRKIFCDLVNHLIEVHHKRKIYCLTGPPEPHQSRNRVLGFRDAMQQHGLPVSEQMIFYGDFWVHSGERLGNAIADGGVAMPEAVACANAAMAEALIRTLQKRGIAVPEDVAVVGYDPFMTNMLNVPSITCMTNMNYNLGVNSVCQLHYEITGEICTPIPCRPEVLEPAESCGCTMSGNGVFAGYKRDLAEQLEFAYLLQYSGMIQKISAPDNLMEFAKELHHVLYLIRRIKVFYLCIGEDWDGIISTNGSTYRTTGYPDTFFLFRQVYGSSDYEIVHLRELVEILQNPETPSAYHLVPLHYEDRCFGFLAVEFEGEQYSLDKQFLTWTEYVSSALETMRIRNYLKQFSGRIHLTAIRDPLTGIYNRRGFEELSSEIYEQSILHGEKFLLVAVDIYNLHEINRKQGSNVGDKILMTVADALSSSCLGNEICCRCNGDHFYLIGSYSYRFDAGRTHIDAIQQYCNQHLEERESGVHVKLLMSCFCEKVSQTVSLAELIAYVDHVIAQKQLEEEKQLAYWKNMNTLRQKIYSRPQENWNIADMAQMMLLSRAYFQRLYKQNFGVSAMSDVIASRIAMAKKLLADGQNTLAEIAEQCGYHSEIYFMQQFKKETGMTPTQYRTKGNAE